MDQLTISDVQHEARQRFGQEEWAYTIMRMQDRFAEIRSGIISLLEGGDIRKSNVEAAIERISIESIRSHAMTLLDADKLHDALVYMRRQLSNLRKRAARILCVPIQVRESIEEFIMHLGEEGHEVPVLKRHAGLEEL